MTSRTVRFGAHAVRLSLRYSPAGPGPAPLKVAFVVVAGPSPLLLGLGLPLTAGLIAAVVRGCDRGHRRGGARPLRAGDNPRWRHRRVRGGLALLLCLVVAGAAWAVAAAGLWNGQGPLPAASIAGAAVAGAAAAGLLGVALWLARDARAHVCPACGAGVRRWRCLGVYVPSPAGGTAKYHRRCARCVECRRPVREAHAAHGRRYHSACFAAQAERMRAHAGYPTKWYAQHRAAVWEEELRCVFADMVASGAVDTALELLRLHPGLAAAPLEGPEGPLPAAALAARSGNGPLLQRLLAEVSGPVDSPGGAALDGRSVRVEGLSGAADGSVDDVYVLQPLLTYNLRPVYVGHAHGHYLYYYEDLELRRRPGWCAGAHLGSGRPEGRVAMPQAGHLPGGGARAAAAVPEKAALRHGKRCSDPEPGPAILDALVGAVRDNLLFPRGAGRVAPEDGAGAETRGSLADAAANPEPGPPAWERGVRTSWIPHAASVLHCAAASGDAATLACALGEYRARHARWLVWQYDAGQGLWRDFLPPAQARIRAAHAAGHAAVDVQVAEVPHLRNALLRPRPLKSFAGVC